MNAIIQTKNLSHRYGDFLALQDLNLTVEPGEIFGYLGPNGAGKTTTIRMLLDFIRPSTGSAQIFGLDSRIDSVAIRQRVGYLPSELKLWENWTGVQYIRWLEDVHKRPCLQEAHQLAERLQFDLNRSLKGMSSGMKRKTGIIASMCHKPDLLIMDEPTNGLDPLMQQVFHELMHQVRAEGRTVFLSSHNLQEVEQICDRVGILREGILQAVESVAKLTHVAFRWLTLTISNYAEMNGFAQIPGVSDVTMNGTELRMRVSGEASIDDLIKLAANYTVEDIRIEQPTLEEIFLAYYGKQEV